MTTLIWILVVAAILAALVLLATRLRNSMLQPEKIQAALHAHYQERLVARKLDPGGAFEIDFIFSAPTDEVAEALKSKLEVAGWRTSAQREGEELIVEALCELSSKEIHFPKARERLLSEAEITGGQYLGPGPKALALVGVDLPQ